MEDIQHINPDRLPSNCFFHKGWR